MIALLLPTLLLCAPALQEVPATNHSEVVVTQGEDGDLLTIRARNASVASLLTKISKELDRELIGLDTIKDTAPLTIYLEDRPANDAIHWLLGSAGLRGRLSSQTITVVDDTVPFPSREELFGIAEVSFMRAQHRFPQFVRAPQAEMSRAEIQESRSQWSAAVVHYDYLTNQHTGSSLVPEAMLRAGKHLARLGEWEMAAERYRRLAALAFEHESHATARLLLADAFCHMNRSDKALHLLDALETNYATQDPAILKDRLLVRSRALSMTGKAIEALRVLDIAAGYGARRSDAAVFVELTALALERSDRPGEAALAWLSHAREIDLESAKIVALANAARLSITSGDELGAIFIHQQAVEAGFGNELEFYANEARERLGLIEENLTDLTDAQRLERAATQMSKGLASSAARSLEKLYRRRAIMTPHVNLRVANDYARALDANGELARAIRVLREMAGLLQRPEDRKDIYLIASDLYEKHDLIEEALEALQGRL